MHHPASIRIGLHTAGPLELPRSPLQRILWERGFAYSPEHDGYVPPPSLPAGQQIHLVHDAVHVLHSLGHPVAHFHHFEEGR
ncbi:hypothetical protein OTB20_18855 [Streptomyces sp. H27-H1]|uniref:hypothetical protein n=1 Tax=Streptomyces sp. H27-H1 TaxID=2996461 RepID=UPI00226FA949|nr:hypothetical protein [Streptomyces sp. H27-H1]MCY0928218.1 hypothetical protein [Streptomyces sp. H27-H1]